MWIERRHSSGTRSMAREPSTNPPVFVLSTSSNVPIKVGCQILSAIKSGLSTRIRYTFLWSLYVIVLLDLIFLPSPPKCSHVFGAISSPFRALPIDLVLLRVHHTSRVKNSSIHPFHILIKLSLSLSLPKLLQLIPSFSFLRLLTFASRVILD